jgi:hypothetical protein
MKKSLLILGMANGSEMSLYDITKRDSVINMNYSKLDKSWTQPGTLGYSLENTGNGLVFRDHLLKQMITLDFAQAQVLRALLKMEDTTNTTFDLLERK